MSSQKVSQIVGKYLFSLDVGLCAKRFHFPPYITPVQGLAVFVTKIMPELILFFAHKNEEANIAGLLTARSLFCPYTQSPPVPFE